MWLTTPPAAADLIAAWTPLGPALPASVGKGLLKSESRSAGNRYVLAHKLALRARALK